MCVNLLVVIKADIGLLKYLPLHLPDRVGHGYAALGGGGVVCWCAQELVPTVLLVTACVACGCGSEPESGRLCFAPR